MKAVEFETTLTHAGDIVLPPEFAGDIPAGQQLRVVVMWEVDAEDSAWRAAGRRSFEDAYSADDDVYEMLIHSLECR
jgi:hypothetical protein